VVCPEQASLSLLLTTTSGLQVHNLYVIFRTICHFPSLFVDDVDIVELCGTVGETKRVEMLYDAQG
jgi:hypothetical protein